VNSTNSIIWQSNSAVTGWSNLLQTPYLRCSFSLFPECDIFFHPPTSSLDCVRLFAGFLNIINIWMNRNFVISR
jgi:hypothetical protein